MSAEPVSITISEADLDALMDHLRRSGRPMTTEELANVLIEIWRRRRSGR